MVCYRLVFTDVRRKMAVKRQLACKGTQKLYNKLKNVCFFIKIYCCYYMNPR